MKALLSGLMLIAVAVAGVGTAWADTLSISADVPITYKFNEAQLHDAKASGALVGVSLPFLLGFGVESYKVTGKAGPGSAFDPDLEYKVGMFDVFVDIPFPVANLRLGGGIGRGTFSIPASTATFDKANLAQGYFDLGIPFAGVFDVHLGYHVISGSTKDTSQTPPASLNLGSKMATVGIKVGF